MSFSSRTRYLLLNAAVLTACAIEFARGYKPIIVIIGAITFILVGNLVLYLSASKERAARRRQKREYWAGQS